MEPESAYKGERHAAKRERMKADYLIEPTSFLERWRQRRAERWLVTDALGILATSLEDTRKESDEARQRWREWRAAQRGEPVATQEKLRNRDS
jgi:hypothetical protein